MKFQVLRFYFFANTAMWKVIFAALAPLLLLGGCGDEWDPDPWVCAEGSTGCFLLINTTVNTYDARSMCRDMGAKLAKIENDEENALVTKLKEEAGLPWVWIGLTSEGRVDDKC